MNYQETAKKIAEDEILVSVYNQYRSVINLLQVLVNLDGHMPGMPQEISALTPAPVQINFLGFPGSMGSPYTQCIQVYINI